MNKFSTKQLLIPIITFAIICLLWFGSIDLGFFTNIIASVVIIIANYIEYKGKAFSELGFQREKFTLKNILVFAPLVALGLFILYVFILVPGITKLTGIPVDYSFFDELKGNFKAYIITLLFVWAGSGFGEEIIFRGYFMRQFIKFFGESKVSIALSILLITGFFGFMHASQGITGQLVSFIVGSLIALIFYLRKYDLWFVIALHGFFNTYALTCVYLGLGL
ncbi:CPBP family intramembrane glutamic endopeptidase [Aquimarina litoralis]|uniref:CPBP family intramembrane glutamic endopeptidase n=1 Tax=Aquimarina litoralis TaxID=584605 RepID=UPI001C55BDB8|nr:CPBP family intramembrane glutamic endopeptidase [Aquimarina litoralis]MBW1299046.1 CPBP family intramembrane metalloprotease [Aquimarina litoralis]